MNTVHAVADHLAWLSPSLGLAAALALVVALAYAVVAVRPFWAVPLYWCVGFAGFAAGQGVALRGWRLLPLGDLALGSGLVACAALFALLHLATLWYTRGRRTQPRARPEPLRRQRLQ